MSEQQMTRENVFTQDKELWTNHSWLLSLIRKKITLFFCGIFVEIHIMCSLETLYTLSTSFYILLSERLKSKRGLKLNQNCPGEHAHYPAFKTDTASGQMWARTVTTQMVIFGLQGKLQFRLRFLGCKNS